MTTFGESVGMRIAELLGRHVLIFAVAITATMLPACTSDKGLGKSAAIAVASDQGDASAAPIESADICARVGLAPAIAFESGSSKLVPCAVQTLNDDIKILLDHPDLKVEVAGHTDSVEGGSDRQALSMQRAKAVYDYLIAHGVPSSMLIGPNGYGSERLLSVDVQHDAAIDEEAAKSNRRVELNVQN